MVEKAHLPGVSFDGVPNEWRNSGCPLSTSFHIHSPPGWDEPHHPELWFPVVGHSSNPTGERRQNVACSRFDVIGALMAPRTPSRPPGAAGAAGWSSGRGHCVGFAWAVSDVSATCVDIYIYIPRTPLTFVLIGRDHVLAPKQGSIRF